MQARLSVCFPGADPGFWFTGGANQIFEQNINRCIQNLASEASQKENRKSFDKSPMINLFL